MLLKTHTKYDILIETNNKGMMVWIFQYLEIL